MCFRQKLLVLLFPETSLCELVAVSAFIIVCKLAINRKINNETVIALHVEMQQTIEVLLWCDGLHLYQAIVIRDWYTFQAKESEKNR